MIKEKLYLNYIHKFILRSLHKYNKNTPLVELFITSQHIASNSNRKKFSHYNNKEKILTLYDGDVTKLIDIVDDYESMIILTHRLLDELYNNVYKNTIELSGLWGELEKVIIELISNVSRSSNLALAYFNYDYNRNHSGQVLISNINKALKNSKISLAFGDINPITPSSFSERFLSLIKGPETNEDELFNQYLSLYDSVLNRNLKKTDTLYPYIYPESLLNLNNFKLTTDEEYENNIIEQYEVLNNTEEYIEKQVNNIIKGYKVIFSTNLGLDIISEIKNNSSTFTSKNTFNKNKNHIRASGKELTLKEFVVITLYTATKQHQYLKDIFANNRFINDYYPNTHNNHTDYLRHLSEYFKDADEYSKIFAKYISKKFKIDNEDDQIHLKKYIFYYICNVFGYQNLEKHFYFIQFFSMLQSCVNGFLASTKHLNTILNYSDLIHSFSKLWNKWLYENRKVIEQLKSVEKLSQQSQNINKKNYEQFISSVNSQYKLNKSSNYAIGLSKTISYIKNLKNYNEKLLFFTTEEFINRFHKYNKNI